MAFALPPYTSRERVMSAPDIRASAFASAQIDEAIESASRRVERLCHRVFWPWTGTRSFDWPNDQYAPSGRLWLDQHELYSLTSIESPDGTTISTSDVQLYPEGGPPYNRLELDRGSSAAFGIGTTSQRSIVITGVWAGASVDETTAGTLASSPTSSSATVTVAGAAYGVGDLLRIGTERLIVTERAWGSSAQTGTLTASNAAQTLTVSDGTAFVAGEELLIDSERLLIRDISGNNLTVQRAWSGSTLAAHTSATIYYSRTLNVTRGAAGTTAASHSSSDVIYRWNPPGPVRTLTMAYALDQFFQEGSGYARIIGADDNQRRISGQAIPRLEEDVYGAYGRIARTRAV